MYRLGCDELYERGYIVVDENGKVSRTHNKPITGALNTQVDSLMGKSCYFWNSSAEGYFKWHFNNSLKD
jgi:hypothetical protein